MSPQRSGTTGAIGVTLNAQKVRSERLRRGWTRKDLASKALVSSMTISNIERGYPCLPATADAIQKAFVMNPPTLDGLIDRERSA